MVESPPANAGDIRDVVQSQVRKIPWKRARQPTPVFLPGESHGQSSMVGYGPWGFKELDKTERLSIPLVCASQLVLVVNNLPVNAET